MRLSTCQVSIACAEAALSPQHIKIAHRVLRVKSRSKTKITERAANRYIDGPATCCAFDLADLRQGQPLISQRIDVRTQNISHSGEKPPSHRRSTVELFCKEAQGSYKRLLNTDQ